MSLELDIAKKIYSARSKTQRSVATPAIKIGIAGVGIAVAAIILSVAIVFGFKREVRNKVIGFGGHIQISNYENNTSYEVLPIVYNDSLKDALKRISGVKQVEPYITREGIIKTSDNFQGVLFKGVDKEFDWDFFTKNLIEGSILSGDSLSNNSTMISEFIAKKLHLEVGDSFLAYFFQEKIQVRKFKIVGIYNTNFENYDKLYVITSLETLRKLNKWSENEVTGVELQVNDFSHLDDVKENVFFEMITYRDSNNNTLYTRSIKDITPYLFDWLSLMDTNVWVIMILMFAVSGFTMSSGLLILILEQTNTIGILKALGYSNQRLRKVFLYVSLFLVLQGLFWGNLVACGFIAVQKLTGIVQLNPENYYVSEVPLVFNIFYILLINVGVLLISVCMMIGPTYLITLIKPAKSIKFD